MLMPGIFDIIKKLLIFLSVFACGTLIGMMLFEPFGAIALGAGLAILATTVFYGYGFIKNVINGETEQESQKGRDKSGGLVNKLEKLVFGQDPKTKSFDNLRSNIADTKKSAARILQDKAKSIYEKHKRALKQSGVEFFTIFWNACLDKEGWKGKLFNFLPNWLKKRLCFDEQYKDFLVKWENLSKTFLRELKCYLDKKQKAMLMEVDGKLEQFSYKKETEPHSKCSKSSLVSLSGQEEGAADAYVDTLRDIALSIIGTHRCLRLLDDKESITDFKNCIREACGTIIGELKESYRAVEPEDIRLKLKDVLESNLIMRCYFKSVRRADNLRVKAPSNDFVAAQTMQKHSEHTRIRAN
jgi:hypothetical protein